METKTTQSHRQCPGALSVCSASLAYTQLGFNLIYRSALLLVLTSVVTNTYTNNFISCNRIPSDLFFYYFFFCVIFHKKPYLVLIFAQPSSVQYRLKVTPIP